MKAVLRWIGAVFGLVVFVLLLAIGWGTSLPLSHAAACSTVINQPTHAVWSLVSDVDRFHTWRSDVTHAERRHSPDGREEWVETDRYGHTVPFAIVSVQPDRRLVSKIADPTLPFGGTWTYALVPAHGGTQITIAEDAEIYNPVFRLLARYAFGYTSAMRRYLADLGRHFGEMPAIGCTAP